VSLVCEPGAPRGSGIREFGPGIPTDASSVSERDADGGIHDEQGVDMTRTQPLTSPAQAQIPGIRRTDLQEHDLSVPGRMVLQNKVELAPDAPSFRHWLPGDEIIYVL